MVDVSGNMVYYEAMTKNEYEIDTTQVANLRKGDRFTPPDDGSVVFELAERPLYLDMKDRQMVTLRFVDGTAITIPETEYVDRIVKESVSPTNRRPWKVCVQSIGPNFAFAREDRARARALELVEREYAEVHVYNVEDVRSTGEVMMERTIYRFDRPPVRQAFVRPEYRWQEMSA